MPWLTDRPTFRTSNVLSGRKRRVKQAPPRLVQADVLHRDRSEPGCEAIVARVNDEVRAELSTF